MLAAMTCTLVFAFADRKKSFTQPAVFVRKS